MPHIYHAYQDNEILLADPVKLVELLYRGAIDSTKDACQALTRGDIPDRVKAINKAGAILRELSLSVDLNQNPELGRNLIELYDYMQRLLNEANANQTEAPLVEVSKLMSTLLDGWVACRVQVSSETDAPPLTESTSGAAFDYYDTEVGRADSRISCSF